jgi:hypothetical protein
VHAKGQRSYGRSLGDGSAFLDVMHTVQRQTREVIQLIRSICHSSYIIPTSTTRRANHLRIIPVQPWRVWPIFCPPWQSARSDGQAQSDRAAGCSGCGGWRWVWSLYSATYRQPKASLDIPFGNIVRRSDTFRPIIGIERDAGTHPMPAPF